VEGEDPRIKIMEDQINRLMDAGNDLVKTLMHEGHYRDGVKGAVQVWRKAIDDQRWAGGYESFEAEAAAFNEWNDKAAEQAERESKAYTAALMDDMMKEQAGATDPNRYWEWRAGEVPDRDEV
jgi:hypothetical protein